MKLSLVADLSDGSGFLQPFITKLNDKLEDGLKMVNYGSNLENIYIGCICVAPQYEKNIEIRKPKFYSKRISDSSGNSKLMYYAYEFEVKFDYESIRNGSEGAYESIFKSKLSEYLEFINTDGVRRKFPELNIEKLIEDVRKILST